MACHAVSRVTYLPIGLHLFQHSIVTSYDPESLHTLFFADFSDINAVRESGHHARFRLHVATVVSPLGFEGNLGCLDEELQQTRPHLRTPHLTGVRSVAQVANGQAIQQHMLNHPTILCLRHCLPTLDCCVARRHLC